MAQRQEAAPSTRSIDVIESGRVDFDKGTTDGLPNEGLSEEVAREDRVWDAGQPKAAAPASDPAMKMAVPKRLPRMTEP